VLALLAMWRVTQGRANTPYQVGCSKQQAL